MSRATWQRSATGLYMVWVQIGSMEGSTYLSGHVVRGDDGKASMNQEITTFDTPDSDNLLDFFNFLFFIVLL